MIVTPNQAQQLLDILDQHFAVYTATTMGEDFLTVSQIETLEAHGFDYFTMYSKYTDHVWMNFQLGLLSEVLGDEKMGKMHFNQFKSWLVKGNYIPLTAKEKAIIDSVKFQSLSDIRAYKNKIFADINGIISQQNINNKQAYEEVIREEVVTGLKHRESIKKIISNLGHKTGDWHRDFSKSVEYISHSALNEGKSSMIKRKGGDEAKVYFIVQDGACKHCIKHYLTAGEGSKPKVFTIKELEANGSNIGKKVALWQATVHSMHPYCRCLMQELPEEYEWDGEKFSPPKHYTSKLHRPKIKVTIGEKEILV